MEKMANKAPLSCVSYRMGSGVPPGPIGAGLSLTNSFPSTCAAGIAAYPRPSPKPDGLLPFGLLNPTIQPAPTLLHTWSLAVEEQFYVFLPLFLICIRKFFPHKQRIIIVFVALTSFSVSAVGAFHSHDATFYLAHTRAWELLLGTLLAMNCFPAISGTLWRNAA